MKPGNEIYCLERQNVFDLNGSESEQNDISQKCQKTSQKKTHNKKSIISKKAIVVENRFKYAREFFSNSKFASVYQNQYFDVVFDRIKISNEKKTLRVVVKLKMLNEKQQQLTSCRMQVPVTNKNRK